MTEISLPDELVERIEKRIEYTDFKSVDEYTAFVLSEVTTRVEREATDTSDETAPREEAEKRLQSLGYLEE